MAYYYVGDGGWPPQAGTLWIIIVGVNGAVALIAFVVVLWYCSKRRRASEYSQRIGMQLTPGEVVSPINSGPHIDGSLPPYSITTVPVYSATVVTTGPTGMRTGTGEDLVLVPRSAVLGHGGVRTTNFSYYNHPPPHPSQQGFSQDMNMNAIREASGAYLARPPPPSFPPSSAQPGLGYGPVIAQVGSTQSPSRQPVSTTYGESQHRGYAQHQSLIPGEEDAPEVDEHSIQARTRV